MHSNRRRASAWLLASLALAGFGGSAFASDNVVVTLTGEIPASCSVASTDTSAFGASLSDSIVLPAFQQGGSADFSFGVNCNAGFSYSLTSTNGRLALQDAVPAPIGAFTDEADYELTLSLPLTGGGSINTTCDSRDMVAASVTACRSGDSAGRAAISQTVNGSVRWSGEDRTTPRLAGTYSDVLVFRMTPTTL